jgi:hypothetical protein
MKAKVGGIKSGSMRGKEKTYFSRLKLDGHLSRIGATIEDRDCDLLITFIEFMSVGVMC